MKVGDLGEFGLLKYLKLEGLDLPKGWVGAGDDAAVIPGVGRSSLLLTTDLLVEGTHFRSDLSPPAALGFKALAVNVSDVAAMGGRPLAFVIGVGLPGEVAADWVGELYRGLCDGARRWGCPLLGGDTVRAPSICLSVAVLGTTGASGPILRSGARPGDDLFVTGTLGESAAGLELLLIGADPADAADRAAVERHLRPQPRLALGTRLGDTGLATAMIDISDGLVQDLGHLLEASGLAAEIHLERVPVAAAQRAGLRRPRDAGDLALTGGEDYELLFAAAPDSRGQIFAAARATATPVRRIGTVEQGRGLSLLRGSVPVTTPRVGGFDHFGRGG